MAKVCPFSWIPRRSWESPLILRRRSQHSSRHRQIPSSRSPLPLLAERPWMVGLANYTHAAHHFVSHFNPLSPHWKPKHQSPPQLLCSSFSFSFSCVTDTLRQTSFHDGGGGRSLTRLFSLGQHNPANWLGEERRLEGSTYAETTGQELDLVSAFSASSLLYIEDDVLCCG